MPTHILTTDLYGSTDGNQDFNDFATTLGGLVPPTTLNIDTKHPIHKLVIQAGHLVDGIQTTYKYADGTHETIAHGVRVGTIPHATHTLELTDTQSIVGVSGKVGPTDYAIYRISFSVLDTKDMSYHNFGPWGTQNSKHSKDFSFSGTLLAFAGTKTGGQEDTGLNSIAFTFLTSE